NDLRGGSFLLRALLQQNDQQLLNNLANVEKNEQLGEIKDQFDSVAANMTPTQLANLLRAGGIPSALSMPQPNAAACPCADKFAPSPSLGPTGNSPFESFVREHPFERGVLEMALGGKIVSGANGTLQVQPFSPGAFNGGGKGNDVAFQAQNMLADMARVA